MKLAHLVPVVVLATLACGGGEAAPLATAAPSFTDETLCKAQCGMLAKHPWDHVQANYCDLCGKHDESACVLDWPFNDVPDCSAYDAMEQCLVGLHGGAALSAVAEANLQTIRTKKANQDGCMNYE